MDKNFKHFKLKLIDINTYKYFAFMQTSHPTHMMYCNFTIKQPDIVNDFLTYQFVINADKKKFEPFIFNLQLLKTIISEYKKNKKKIKGNCQIQF